MKALELLKGDRAYCLCINNDKSIIKQYDEAIKELEILLDERNQHLDIFKQKQFELTPKYNYTYIQLYHFIFVHFRKGIKLKDITKDMIETSIEENKKILNGRIQGSSTSFVIYDDL